MKALYERWTAISLPKRILGGMILGAVLGMMIPQAVGISILGNLFVNALKGIAPLLVFFLVISSLCQAKQSHGGIIRTVVCLYLFNTLLGAVIAVIASSGFVPECGCGSIGREVYAGGGRLQYAQICDRRRRCI